MLASLVRFCLEHGAPCYDHVATTLLVLNHLEVETLTNEVTVPEEVADRARAAVERMLEVKVGK